jgi:hypothetical protein
MSFGHAASPLRALLVRAPVVRAQVARALAVLAALLPAAVVAAQQPAASPADSPAAIEVQVTNPGVAPPLWKLSLDENGRGQFDAEAGPPHSAVKDEIVLGEIHRPVQFSPGFTAHVFAVARERKFFAFPCEGHMKVAFQGTKRLSYTGPDGSGACEYNYSRDKAIQELGESFMAVETTLLFGARLEKLLQHDRLGLDQAMEDLAAAVHSGSAIEVGAIRETLDRIASDDEVLERARRKARLLLAQAH